MAFKKFKIRTRQTKHYFLCYVFDTKKEMYSFFDAYSSSREHNGEAMEKFRPIGCEKNSFAAIVMPYEIRDKTTGNLHNEIGLALFFRGKLGSGLIAHEMAHCSFWYDRIVNNNIPSEYGSNVCENEERFCYILTDFVKDFVSKCYKYNLL